MALARQNPALVYISPLPGQMPPELQVLQLKLEPSATWYKLEPHTHPARLVEATLEVLWLGQSLQMPTWSSSALYWFAGQAWHVPDAPVTKPK